MTFLYIYIFFGRFNSSLGRWRCHRRQQTCGSGDRSIVPVTELYSLAAVVDSILSASIARVPLLRPLPRAYRCG